MPTAPSSSTRRTYTAICTQLDELRALARQPDLAPVRAEEVSGWSVGEHLQHLLLSDRTILVTFDKLLDGKSTSSSGGPTAAGRFILTSGYIPRGKGTAPKAVVPGTLSPDEIASGFEEVKTRFEELEPRLGEIQASRATFRHPLLGDFNPRQWLKFVKIHHRHHTKIIRDIGKAAAREAA
ncbi:MAG: hypothetical protein EP299_08140 [Acidobacteria bacterium]|nr:MAG: hypothetical protein EP299_08140 [Acidobacteriota bacterium]